MTQVGFLAPRFGGPRIEQMTLEINLEAGFAYNVAAGVDN